MSGSASTVAALPFTLRVNWAMGAYLPEMALQETISAHSRRAPDTGWAVIGRVLEQRIFQRLNVWNTPRRQSDGCLSRAEQALQFHLHQRSLKMFDAGVLSAVRPLSGGGESDRPAHLFCCIS